MAGRLYDRSRYNLAATAQPVFAPDQSFPYVRCRASSRAALVSSSLLNSWQLSDADPAGRQELELFTSNLYPVLTPLQLGIRAACGFLLAGAHRWWCGRTETLGSRHSTARWRELMATQTQHCFPDSYRLYGLHFRFLAAPLGCRMSPSMIPVFPSCHGRLRARTGSVNDTKPKLGGFMTGDCCAGLY